MVSNYAAFKFNSHRTATTTKDKWDDIADLIHSADYPSHAWIALGAGTYTPWVRVRKQRGRC